MELSLVDKNYAYAGELGALYSQAQTTFRVWSPLAEKAAVKLYQNAGSRIPYCVCKMQRSGNSWEATIPGDLHGVFYTYEFTSSGKSRETIDIYARSAGANGVRGMVVDLSRTDPDGWENDRPVKLESYTDAVIYELHVRDFSSDESGNFKLRGKFGAFCEKGVTNGFSDAIGLDHIASLGITHIHLLPVFDYQTVDETDPEAGFNWGYDPLNYNIPEGSYTTDPDNGTQRVKQFKELIHAAHKKGIGVIMDVVYNHTYSTEKSPFTKTFPGYYYRHNADGSLSDGSACGNEFASERVMASRFIVDSLCYLAEEYKLDGFRFDLMGLLDIQTLNKAAEKLRRINPSVILYGEGWTGGASPLDEGLRAMKKNAVELPQFAMFSDDFRDGVKGSVFEDEGCGYVNGNAEELSELMKSVISAGVFRSDVERPESECWTDTPQQAVNYVEAHDNLTLFDKLRVSMPSASEEACIAADKLAAALVFLSQGIPFMQAGQELLRSKPAPSGGFVHDSYNSPDSVNGIKWNDVTIRRSVMEYYRGLIAIRKRFPEFRLRTSEKIRTLVKYEDIGSGALAVHYGEKFLLLINPGEAPLEYPLPGAADIYADSKKADAQPLYQAEGVVSVKPCSIILAGF